MKITEIHIKQTCKQHNSSQRMKMAARPEDGLRLVRIDDEAAHRP